MSVAEIKEKVASLTIGEQRALLAELEAMVRASLTARPPLPWASYVGCTQGNVLLLPGWDEPEDPMIWHAMHDDMPL